MTFIASVVAKDGVAIIADSFVTTSENRIEAAHLLTEITERKKANGNKPVSFSEHDLIKLLKPATSYTKDYQQKLMQFDKNTAFTTTGRAYINGKSIADIVSGVKKKLQKKGQGYRISAFRKNMASFKNELEKEVKNHLKDHGELRSITKLIATHYSPLSKKQRVSIIDFTIKASVPKDLNDSSFEFIAEEDKSQLPVFCDGQNRICERILFGDLLSLGTIVPHITKVVREELDNLNIKEGNQLPNDFYNTLFEPVKFFNDEMLKDSQIKNLSPLSLQQAVNLAYLLMKIEIDFQKYTKKIATVGGLIKLAIIDADGFRYIKGGGIRDPKEF